MTRCHTEGQHRDRYCDGRRDKKRMARGGKLDIEIDYVKLADGEKAAIRAVKETKGGGHTGAMTGAIVATSLVVWPAAPFFLFMHGKDTTIPKGTEITAYVNGTVLSSILRSTLHCSLPGGAACCRASNTMFCKEKSSTLYPTNWRDLYKLQHLGFSQYIDDRHHNG